MINGLKALVGFSLLDTGWIFDVYFWSWNGVLKVSSLVFQSYILDASRRSSVMQLSSSPISSYFCIISAPTETPAWLWKSQAASSIAMCYARASTKAKKKKNNNKKTSNKAGLRPFLYTSVLQQQPMKNRAFHTLCKIFGNMTTYHVC